MTACRQTADVLERYMGDAPTPTDARHVAECARCSGALARLPGFRAGLASVTRSLAADPLPAGVLEVTSDGASTAAGGAIPRPSAGVVARFVSLAAVIVLAATLLTLAARYGPLSPGAGPRMVALEDQATIVAELREAAYVCGDTVLGPLASPATMGTLCRVYVLAGDIDGAVALARGRDGSVADVTIKASLGDASDRMSGIDRLRRLVLDASVATLNDTPDAAAATRWIGTALAELGSGQLRTTQLGGMHISVERFTSEGYGVRLVPEASRP